MNITSNPMPRNYVRLPQTIEVPRTQPGAALPVNATPVSDADSLRAKLIAGQELTPAELEYLKQHAPDLYHKAVKVAQERESYKSSLSQSRTKNETIELHNQTLTRVLAEVKNSDADEIMMHVNAIQDTYRTFVHSKEYAKLEWEKNGLFSSHEPQ
ncbi:MAG: hypothetical protein J7639_29275 [Paenibacillaceae bacterium]|nr:hypothetical protein [Paenibacillaceae bacterium]